MLSQLKQTQLIHRVTNKIHAPLPLFRVMHRREQKFECPICSYQGPFKDLSSFAGVRKHAMCPSCGSLERHRLQYLVVSSAPVLASGKRLKVLHFAPEKFLIPIFSSKYGNYETADLTMDGVDHKVDIQNLPFQDDTYDFVFASHVLEHIGDDRKAVREIRRVLRTDGVAILPVPIVCNKTIEYSEPNPLEAGHVRAPGLDYFDRYREHFRKVEVYSSESFGHQYQLFVYEDRSQWPIPACPLRPPMSGEKHPDFVPVCYA